MIEISTGINEKRKRSCGKVIFSQACVKNSVHGAGGVCLSACWDTPPGQTPSPPPGTPCPVHAGIDMATAADGTHPTGMHSCFDVKIEMLVSV